VIRNVDAAPPDLGLGFLASPGLSRRSRFHGTCRHSAYGSKTPPRTHDVQDNILPTPIGRSLLASGRERRLRCRRSTDKVCVCYGSASAACQLPAADHRRPAATRSIEILQNMRSIIAELEGSSSIIFAACDDQGSGRQFPAAAEVREFERRERPERRERRGPRNDAAKLRALRMTRSISCHCAVALRLEAVRG
jgi:hypothetical protein